MTAPTPSIPSFTDGTVVHQANLNALASNLTNLYNYTLGGFYTSPPLCIATQTTTQAFATNTYVAVTYNSTVVNTGNMWVASQPTQLTIQTAGVYLIAAQVLYTANGTGARELNICVNGTVPVSNAIMRSDSLGNSGYDTGVNGTTFYRLAVNNTIYVVGAQNSGSTINTHTGTGLITTSLSAMWVSP